ncbi:MAG: GNAT family N-acetyltransferase [Phycisphaerales bacterium JB059]
MNEIREAVASAFEVRPLTSDDRPWVQRVLRQYWASTTQVARGRIFKADELPGFAAWRGDEPVGVITYDIQGDQCEIITHNALAGHGGVGSCLLAEVRTLARERGCKRLWLVTTNDNTQAMRFYQRRGFDFAALHKNAIAEARRLKPEIPDVGMDGVPIRHEIEMEQML